MNMGFVYAILTALTSRLVVLTILEVPQKTAFALSRKTLYTPRILFQVIGA